MLEVIGARRRSARRSPYDKTKHGQAAPPSASASSVTATGEQIGEPRGTIKLPRVVEHGDEPPRSGWSVPKPASRAAPAIVAAASPNDRKGGARQAPPAPPSLLDLGPSALLQLDRADAKEEAADSARGDAPGDAATVDRATDDGGAASEDHARSGDDDAAGGGAGDGRTSRSRSPEGAPRAPRLKNRPRPFHAAAEPARASPGVSYVSSDGGWGWYDDGSSSEDDGCAPWVACATKLGIAKTESCCEPTQAEGNG